MSRLDPFFLILVASTAAAGSVEEQVRVGLIQLEVSVWPDDGRPESCRGLTAADFELTVDREPREIYAVDRLGEAEAAVAPEVPPAEEAPPTEKAAREPLTLVLVFDLWHLDLFYRRFDCPKTKPLAFEQARRLVREELREGDRLLLVTFAGWPQVHHGWFRDRGEALRALDRLETTRQVVAGRRTHLHHKEWIEGMKSLLLALGRYPGHKDVIYLGDDFRFDDEAGRLFEYAARAQSNGVVVSAVDLLASCRTVPGPGPSLACPARGGLGCTDFRFPVALTPVSEATGGRLFRNESVTAAVRSLREMRGCRYLVSFRHDEGRRKRSAPRLRVRLVNGKGLSLQAPESFQDPARPPDEREEQDALFLLPLFGRGIATEVGLWPLRPSGKKKRWKALMVARIGRSPGEAWPDGLTRIVVDAVAHQGSKIRGDFRKVIEGKELERLRDTDQGHTLVLPLEKIRPGETTVVVRAMGDAGEVAANARSAFVVPEPPGAGEARPWFLVDRLARVGEAVTMLPSLDGLLAVGEPAVFVGYGCRADGPRRDIPAGEVVSWKNDWSWPVPIGWLDGEPPGEESGGCGWLVGRVGSELEPGLWRFEPPPSMNGDEETEPIDFRVR